MIVQPDESASRYAYMLEQLPQKWVPFKVIDYLFGISQDDAHLWGDFRAWASRLRRPQEVYKSTLVDRHAFESYLQRAGLLPLKLAAARLGMTADSFQDVLSKLETQSVQIASTLSFSKQVVPEELIRSFHKFFPALIHKVLTNVNSYIQDIHQEVRNDLGIEVTPIHCVTSSLLDEAPDYAYEYDCLTGEPIGLRYEVWLNFKKPINLRPDACSWKLYVKHQDVLMPLLLSHEPEIPAAQRQKL